MTWEDIRRELSKDPWNAYYTIQGHILWWLFKRIILRYKRKSERCRICYESGFCRRCGCPINQMIMSSKPCIPIWDKVVYDLQIVYPGEQHLVTFNYQGDKDLSSGRSDCNCTNPVINANQVLVTYNTPTFPEHLDPNKVYPVEQNIYITDSSGTDHRLTVIGLLKHSRPKKGIKIITQ